MTHDERAPAVRPPRPLSETLRSTIAANEVALKLDSPKARLLLLLGLGAALAGGFYLWRSQPVAEPLPPLPTGAVRPVALPSSPVSRSPAAAEVTVHVAGKVRRPGVFTLPDGSRVEDAVAAAGGPKRGVATDSINLARRLMDGEQIIVGGPPVAHAPAQVPAPDAPGVPRESGLPGALIDLNTATVEQLDVLPGVGEVLARRIVDYRTANGGFRTVDQLQEVSGIGDSKFADIKDKVRV
ncbi:ComEA family DNA-binding protein [Spongiactinospora rosea]|uniref:ComEA family DNA-binding protein n=2 Tax=Spongiactinospora rosea TaxID=2248750 RepID=A0A366LLV9_9ACTN|nr:ComEA family DNA-binding protein [Spongiactinospora rosea]